MSVQAARNLRLGSVLKELSPAQTHSLHPVQEYISKPGPRWPVLVACSCQPSVRTLLHQDEIEPRRASRNWLKAR